MTSPIPPRNDEEYRAAMTKRIGGDEVTAELYRQTCKVRMNMGISLVDITSMGKNNEALKKIQAMQIEAGRLTRDCFKLTEKEFYDNVMNDLSQKDKSDSKRLFIKTLCGLTDSEADLLLRDCLKT